MINNWGKYLNHAQIQLSVKPFTISHFNATRPNNLQFKTLIYNVYLIVNWTGMLKFPKIACKYGATLVPLDAYPINKDDRAWENPMMKKLRFGKFLSAFVILLGQQIRIHSKMIPDTSAEYPHWPKTMKCAPTLWLVSFPGNAGTNELSDEVPVMLVTL